MAVALKSLDTTEEGQAALLKVCDDIKDRVADLKARIAVLEHRVATEEERADRTTNWFIGVSIGFTVLLLASFFGLKK